MCGLSEYENEKYNVVSVEKVFGATGVISSCSRWSGDEGVAPAIRRSWV